MGFLAKYWKQFLIAGLILFVLIYIWYRGKKSGEAGKPKVIDIMPDIFDPNSGAVVVDGSKIRRIATSLHDDMDGFNWGHDDQVYQEFAGLSDSEFTAVYNDFNERYYAEGNGTLKEWIDDEIYGNWTIIDDVIMPKMNRLNLN
jgi:hypothetical protein